MIAPLDKPVTIERFESGDIDADRFDHAAHVYIAWLYVRKYDLAEAIFRFDGALRRLTSKLGMAGKYHATITGFFLLKIAERSRKNEGWSSFKARNQDLVSDGKKTLQRHYTDARLFSDTARIHFVLPDRLAT